MSCEPRETAPERDVSSAAWNLRKVQVSLGGHMRVAARGNQGEKNMGRQELPAATRQQYAAAYEAHCTTKDRRLAPQLYKGVMVEYPDSVEAGYSRSQIQDMAHAVVSAQDLCEAQRDLASARVKDSR